MSRRRKRRPTKQQFSGFKPVKLVGRSENQVDYIRSITGNDIILCSGPPGSGKTHIAVGAAVKALRAGAVEKVILTRPVVEVGNSIGYLPGDVEDKVGPYLIPLFDELDYYVEHKHVTKLMAEGRIEICPLSMMRGRTFVNTFVILDEAQNALRGELRMFLTRIGAESKLILTGDFLQSDLRERVRGGFRECLDKLRDMDGVEVINLDEEDIVRHPLICEIEKRLK